MSCLEIVTGRFLCNLLSSWTLLIPFSLVFFSMTRFLGAGAVFPGEARFLFVFLQVSVVSSSELGHLL